MSSISITVLYFASIREEIGQRDEALVLDGASRGGQQFTLADVRRRLCAMHPDAAASIAPITLARNLEYADDDTPVHDGDEVALIPPISGG